MGGEKKTGRVEGRSKCEEVEVFSKGRHMPDHLSRRKDITLFASIVPLCAKTINYRLASATRYLQSSNFTRVKQTGTCANHETDLVKAGNMAHVIIWLPV